MKRISFSQKRIMALIFVLAVMVMYAVPALAEESGPITVINNMSSFTFSVIRAVGIILLGMGIMQVGLSFKSQDPSQRANGFLSVAGGVLITFAKEILTLITGSAV